MHSTIPSILGSLRRILAVTAVILCIMEQGCEPVVRHRMLSFFLDGVPPLETPEKQENLKPEERMAKDRSSQVKKETSSPEAREVKPPAAEMVQHPPYAMKMCDNCHVVGKSDMGAPMAFSLLEDRNKLCSMCHMDKSQEELKKTYAWVHGPVQFGACLQCHNPHESPNPYMLKEKPVSKLCLGCHDREQVLKTDTHAQIGDTDCTECHNPHGSQVRYLLRS